MISLSLENSLIVHCAPTLAGIKTANLYSFQPDDPEQFAAQFRHWSEWFSRHGLELLILEGRGRRRSFLLYLYRPAALRDALSSPGVEDFLSSLGYTPSDGQAALLHRLSNRLRSQRRMPDEIGIFLGYPLEDVLGFIQNKGKNYTHAGCWKCYGDPERARSRFAGYRACEAAYLRRFADGVGVKQLTVPA